MSHGYTHRGHRKLHMHARDVFHAETVDGAEFCGRFDLPSIPAIQEVPVELIPFSVAKDSRCHAYHCHVHFYEDDYRFECLWNRPERYLPKLIKFAGAISPDFSTCVDFPGALKVWNTYRDRALGSKMARCGIPTIPNVRVERSCEDWQLDGLPRNSLIAIGARACVKDPDDRRLLVDGLCIACERLHPTGIIWYGSTGYGMSAFLDALEVPIYPFPGRGRGELGGDSNE